MFGPFASPYLYMMQRGGIGGLGGPGVGGMGAPQQPDFTSTATPPFVPSTGGVGGFGGFGGPVTSPAPVPQRDPFALDADANRRARNQGLVALGAQLLDASSTGDVAGGLARGIMGFQQGRQQALDRERALRGETLAEQRRQAAESRAMSAEQRAIAQEEDRDRAADLDTEASRLNLDHARTKMTRETDLRTRTAKSAEQMVKEINDVAAANPGDDTLQRSARRAAAYVLGEDSDLDKLGKLHEDLIGRAGLDADYDRQTDASIRRAQEEAELGIGPIAEAQRARENQAMDRERLGIYRQEAGRRASSVGASGVGVKPATWYDDVDKEINKLLDPVIRERSSKVGEIDQEKMMSPEFMAEAERRRKAGQPPPPIPRISPLTPEEIDGMRRRVEPGAIASVDRRYGARGASPTSAKGPDIARRDDAGGQRGQDRDQANHVRNLAADALAKGGDPEQLLSRLRSQAQAQGGRLFGFTPEQYLENAKAAARRRGWKG